MATNELRAAMRHVGLKLLEHANVEMREDRSGAKYAVITQPDPEKLPNIWLGDPGYVQTLMRSWGTPGELTHEHYRNYLIGRRDADVYAYADAPLKIRGLYRSRTSSTITFFRLTPSGKNRKFTFYRGDVRQQELETYDFSTISLQGLQPISFGDLRGFERRQFLALYGRMLTIYGSTGADRVRGQQFLSGLRLVGIDENGLEIVPSPEYVHGWRPSTGFETWRSGQYLDLKRRLKELGRRAIGKGDMGLFAQLLNDITNVPGGDYFTHSLAAAWNRLYPDRELVHTTCGHLEERGDVTEGTFNGETFCRHCIANGNAVFLDDLQGYTARGRGSLWSDGVWRSYAEPEAGTDDDGDFEGDDFSDPPGVRSYGTDVRTLLRPDTTIKSSQWGEFLMGIELEVVPYSRQHDAVADTLDSIAKGYAILKSDGSLPDEGFEIVTAPRGLKEHIERFSSWEPYHSLRAWDAGCAGMHVHISSQAFNASTLGKFLELINSNSNDQFIHSIAGRHPHWDEQARDYCQRDGCEIGNPKKTLANKSATRYRMVNTTNLTRHEAERLGLGAAHADDDRGRRQNTIELRVFRASLKKARLLAQIEFAHAAVMFSRWSSMRELDKDHFLKWLQTMAGVYPNLAKWYGVRANKKAIEERPAVRASADV